MLSSFKNLMAFSAYYVEVLEIMADKVFRQLG